MMAETYVDPMVAFYEQFRDKRDRACNHKLAIPGTDPVLFGYVLGVGSKREKDFWYQAFSENPRRDRAARCHAANYGVRRIGKKA